MKNKLVQSLVLLLRRKEEAPAPTANIPAAPIGEQAWARPREVDEDEVQWVRVGVGKWREVPANVNPFEAIMQHRAAERQRIAEGNNARRQQELAQHRLEYEQAERRREERQRRRQHRMEEFRRRHQRRMEKLDRMIATL